MIHSASKRGSFYFYATLLLVQCGWSDGTPVATSLSTGMGAMPTLQTIDAKCGRGGMTIHLTFDRPFLGVIYSKGHFYDPDCNYVKATNTQETQFSFLVGVDKCGTRGNLDPPTPEQDMFYENTIVIQNDPLIQEIWDEARRLKCTWQHSFSKAVRTNPITVEGPDMVKIDFDSRSVNSLMKIERGKSLFSFPALGYIHVGDDTSLVIYLKDSSGGLDANAVSCVASSSKGKSVDLVDRNGCVVNADLLRPFSKLRNPPGVEADLMLYSYFKAFRIDNDPDFKISCQLEVCEGSCLEPCALGPYPEEFGSPHKRGRRALRSGASPNPSRVVELEYKTVILDPRGSELESNEREGEKYRDNLDETWILEYVRKAKTFNLVIQILVFVLLTMFLIFMFKALTSFLLQSTRKNSGDTLLDIASTKAKIRNSEKLPNS